MVLVTVMEAKYFLTLSPYYSFRVRFPLVSLAAIFVMHTTLFPNKWPLTFKPHSFPNLSPSQLWFYLCRAVKKFLSSRLIMNSRQLWNLHQRHNFLRAEAAGDILKFGVSEMTFPGVFKRYFAPWTSCCFVRLKTGNIAIEMSQSFHDITQFQRFTDLNLWIRILKLINYYSWEQQPINEAYLGHTHGPWYPVNTRMKILWVLISDQPLAF